MTWRLAGGGGVRLDERDRRRYLFRVFVFLEFGFQGWLVVYRTMGVKDRWLTSGYRPSEASPVAGNTLYRVYPAQQFAASFVLSPHLTPNQVSVDLVLDLQTVEFPVALLCGAFKMCHSVFETATLFTQLSRVRRLVGG